MHLTCLGNLFSNMHVKLLFLKKLDWIEIQKHLKILLIKRKKELNHQIKENGKKESPGD